MLEPKIELKDWASSMSKVGTTKIGAYRSLTEWVKQNKLSSTLLYKVKKYRIVKKGLALDHVFDWDTDLTTSSSETYIAAMFKFNGHRSSLKFTNVMTKSSDPDTYTIYWLDKDFKIVKIVADNTKTTLNIGCDKDSAIYCVLTFNQAVCHPKYYTQRF